MHLCSQVSDTVGRRDTHALGWSAVQHVPVSMHREVMASSPPRDPLLRTDMCPPGPGWDHDPPHITALLSSWQVSQDPTCDACLPQPLWVPSSSLCVGGTNAKHRVSQLRHNTRIHRCRYHMCTGAGYRAQPLILTPPRLTRELTPASRIRAHNSTVAISTRATQRTLHVICGRGCWGQLVHGAAISHTSKYLCFSPCWLI